MKTLIVLCICLPYLFSGVEQILDKPEFNDTPSIREYLAEAGGATSEMRWQDLRPGYGLFMRIPNTWTALEEQRRDGRLPGKILASYTNPEGSCKLGISVLEGRHRLLSLFGEETGQGIKNLGYPDKPRPSLRRLTVDGRPAVLITASGTHCYSKDIHEPFDGYNEMLLVRMPGYILNIRLSYAYADQPHNLGKLEMEHRVERELTQLGQAVMHGTRLAQLPGSNLPHLFAPLRKYVPWQDINADYGLSFSLPREAYVAIPAEKDSAELLDLIEFTIPYKEATLKSAIYLQPPGLSRDTVEYSDSGYAYTGMEAQWSLAFQNLLESSFMDEIYSKSGAVLNIAPMGITKISGHSALISRGSITVPVGGGRLSSEHWYGEIHTPRYLLSLHSYILFNDKLPPDQSGRSYLEDVHRKFLGSLDLGKLNPPFSSVDGSAELVP